MYTHRIGTILAFVGFGITSALQLVFIGFIIYVNAFIMQAWIINYRPLPFLPAPFIGAIASIAAMIFFIDRGVKKKYNSSKGLVAGISTACVISLVIGFALFNGWFTGHDDEDVDAYQYDEVAQVDPVPILTPMPSDESSDTAKTVKSGSIRSDGEQFIFVDEVTDFLFIPSASGIWTFQTSISGESDPYLWLFNSSGDLLEENDDGAEELNALISFHLTAGSQYTLRAGFYDGGSGFYVLSVSADNTIHSVEWHWREENWDIDGIPSGTMVLSNPITGCNGFRFGLNVKSGDTGVWSIYVWSGDDEPLSSRNRVGSISMSQHDVWVYIDITFSTRDIHWILVHPPIDSNGNWSGWHIFSSIRNFVIE
jgi:hypothetical protein